MKWLYTVNLTCYISSVDINEMVIHSEFDIDSNGEVSAEEAKV